MDVAIGMVAGAPPVPAATTLRTQLVDLVSFLRGAGLRDPGEAMPDPEIDNARWRHERRDYYYDSVRRQTDRLETPFLPVTQAGPLGAAVSALVRRVPRILAGEQVFRPVRPSEGDPIALAQDSSLRGGNTFVFDLDLLRDVPNLSPCVDGRRLRRSDMLWATLARFSLRRAVRTLPIFVEHDWSHEQVQGLDPDKLFDDILGYAFARAFEQHCRFRGDPRAGAPLRFDEKAREEVLEAHAQVRARAPRRAAAVQLSHPRAGAGHRQPARRGPAPRRARRRGHGDAAQALGDAAPRVRGGGVRRAGSARGRRPGGPWVRRVLRCHRGQRPGGGCSPVLRDAARVRRRRGARVGRRGPTLASAIVW